MLTVNKKSARYFSRKKRGEGHLEIRRNYNLVHATMASHIQVSKAKMRKVFYRGEKEVGKGCTVISPVVLCYLRRV